MPTPEQTQQLGYAVNDFVVNRRGGPIILDRQAYPLLSFLMANKEQMPFTGGVAKVKLQKSSDLDIEHYEGKQVLTFQENKVDAELEFQPRRSHLGIEYTHTELEDLGYSIEPNAPRGKMFAKKVPEAAVDMVKDLFAMRQDDAMDRWDVRLDRLFHLANAADPLAPTGIDGLLPIVNPTAGTIGGQPRTDPLFQHNVQTGLTAGAGGNLDAGLEALWRACHLNNRGTPTRINAIFAGYDFIDAYKAFARANGMEYERNGGIKAVTGLDLGLPDSALHYNGVPIIHDPTMESLDAEGLGGGIDWSKRCYMLSSKATKLGYAKNKLKQFSAPNDPGDQRITRQSLEGRHCLMVTKPSANGIAAIS